MQATKKVSGFTIIELLIVITIISILMGLAAAAFTGVIRKARTAEAATIISTMKQAMGDYLYEYTDYPPALLEEASSPDEDAAVVVPYDSRPPSSAWRDLYTVFMAPEDADEEFMRENNPKRIPFLGSFPGRYTNSPKNPAEATTILDVWGREFCLIVDSNGDNKIEDLPGEKGRMNLTIHGDFAMWSWGPSPEEENYKTIVKSW